MSSDSTSEIEDTLRTRLLEFAPLAGDPLPDVLGRTEQAAGANGALFWDAAPDKLTAAGTTTPLNRWGVMRLMNRRSRTDGQEGEQADLEIMFFGRPRNQKATLELCADLCDQALLRFKESSGGGLIGIWGRMRSTLPPFQSPADAEVVQIRLVYTVYILPAYLTQYSTE